MQPTSNPPGYALFDLDQTLVPYDMQLLFGNWCLQHQGWRRVYLVFFLAALPVVKLIGARRMKRLYMAFLHGMSVEEVDQLTTDFVEHYFPGLFYDETVALLREQQEQGNLVILTSASPSLYVHKIGQKLGVDHTFCTEVTPPADFFPLFPEVPENNKGAVKTTRLYSWLRDQGITDSYPLPNSTAYTDSSADLPLVGATEQTVLVHPSAKLEATVKEDYKRPYTIYRPERPFSGQIGHLLHSLQKLIGVYPL